MRKLLVVLLCMVCLCAVGCSSGEGGCEDMLYTADGITQSAHVRLILPDQALNAPVTALSFEIHNATDYVITCPPSTLGEYVLEYYQNGAWEQCPRGGLFVGKDIVVPDLQIPANGMEKYEISLGDHAYFAVLSAGVYRMRIPASASAASEPVSFALVAYFTVT